MVTSGAIPGGQYVQDVQESAPYNLSAADCDQSESAVRF